MTLPQRSGLESSGHIVIVGKTMSSIGKVRTTDLIGFSYHPASLNCKYKAKLTSVWNILLRESWMVQSMYFFFHKLSQTDKNGFCAKNFIFPYIHHYENVRKCQRKLFHLWLALIIEYFIFVLNRDIHIECSKQFKWNSYFYVSVQNRPFWAALKLL